MNNELKVSSNRTGGKITKILYKLNLQAKEEIKGWFDYRTPFEFQKSLMFLEYIIWKTIEISESIKDERVQLEPMGRIAHIDAQMRRHYQSKKAQNRFF